MPPNLLEELVVSRDRTATRALIGVDHGVIDDQLIDAATPAYEFRGNAELTFDPRRQTGGLWEEVSLDAVFDPYLQTLCHGHSFLQGQRLGGRTPRSQQTNGSSESGRPLPAQSATKGTMRRGRSGGKNVGSSLPTFSAPEGTRPSFHHRPG